MSNKYNNATKIHELLLAQMPRNIANKSFWRELSTASRPNLSCYTIYLNAVSSNFINFQHFSKVSFQKMLKINKIEETSQPISIIQQLSYKLQFSSISLSV